MYVHGSDDRDVSINVDGLSIDAQDDNGIQGYYNEAMIQEIAYTTSAISADSAKGGVRMNMIAQEGGNAFAGSSYISTSPSAWQSDNLSQELIDRGLPSPDGIAHISDLAIAQGGADHRQQAVILPRGAAGQAGRDRGGHVLPAARGGAEPSRADLRRAGDRGPVHQERVGAVDVSGAAVEQDLGVFRPRLQEQVPLAERE